MKRLLVLIVLLPAAATADERILDWHSDILVSADGTLDVTETIIVRAEGRDIRRGIVRAFPTRYEDDRGNDVVVHYEPKAALRDGEPEPYHTEERDNGVYAYIGRSDVFLDPGEYTYTWRYEAGRMLGFFDDHDELYWNVTGLGWDFPIDSVSATVRFGFDVAAGELALDAYSGPRGATGCDCASSAGAGVARFATTAPLGPHEGLTVVVSWPKGLVTEPTRGEHLALLLADNRHLLIAGAGFLLLLFYYLPVWHHFGRDPAAGVVVTRYEPPRRFSPASIRYIREMGYDNRTFTAAVVSLAVKGRLTIEKDGDDYILERREPPADAEPLATGESELLTKLFETESRVTLDQDNHEIFRAARSAHKASLSADYRNRYFRTNGLMNLPGVLVLVATAIIALGTGGPRPFTFVILGGMLLTVIVFPWLLKQPTGIGRRLMDQAEGFREYLDIAEKDELNLRNPPEKTPALFERYLPFALALGVEQHWAERFSAVFAGLRAGDGSSYHPAWYHGSWNEFDTGSMTSQLTSGLDSAISSSMTAPGSSSGSGGGGFSGGGGGGGGGGGW